ncbi:MAG: DUF4157 domain-containing protein [Kofleriaceae bacterium]|nr:DUF4157 domain-containing protein [Kofleriaceae bacterium]MCL4226765.1 DUF4157 domain-containing protein [Myxococcales bacterium]
MSDQPSRSPGPAPDHPRGASASTSSAPGRSTLTSRLGPSPASIARAVVAQLKAAESPAPAAAQAHGDLDGPDVHALAAQGTAGGGGTLPFLDEIQRAFGHHDVSGVRAHVGGAAAEASAAMGARAYAAGDAVAFAEAPDLHLAAHEAAHVVQQRSGVSLKGGVGQAGDAYEQHADAVADRVVRGESVESLLDHGPGGAHSPTGSARPPVQRWQRIGVERYEAGPIRYSADRRVREFPVLVGTEQEWRSSEERAKDRFLRACYVSDEEFASFARRNQRDDEVMGPLILGSRPSRSLTRRPTHEERVTLAKVLYLRGERGRYRGEGALAQQLIDDCQHDVLNGLAHGSWQPNEDMGSGLADASTANALQMISSASASLLRGLAGRVANYDSAEANSDDRLIQYACRIITNSVQQLQEDETQRRESVTSLVEAALAPIPVPERLKRCLGEVAAEQFVSHSRDLIQHGVIEALSRESRAVQRLSQIRRSTWQAIDDLRRPEQMTLPDYNTLRTALRGLVGQGLAAGGGS